jgi:precorrin-3B methylase
MAIVRPVVDQEPILSVDDMLEILSMLKPVTLTAFEQDIVITLYNVKAEALERDLDKQTDDLITKQVRLCDIMIELFGRAREELDSLNDKVT